MMTNNEISITDIWNPSSKRTEIKEVSSYVGFSIALILQLNIKTE